MQSNKKEKMGLDQIQSPLGVTKIQDLIISFSSIFEFRKLHLKQV
jgi:hypothetical protein